MKNLQGKVLVCLSFALLLLLSTLIVNAQKGEAGLRFMPTFSSFNIQTSSGGTVKGEVTLGYGFGALLGYNFSKHVGVQGELIYSSLSQKYKESEIERKITLRYLNIPLLLSLNSGKDKPINFNAVIGPQIGISVGSSIFTKGDNGPNPAVLSVKKGDLGFAYGAGVDFGLNPAHTFRLGLGFRGVYGLIDISDNTNTITTDYYYLLGRSHVKTYAGYVGVSYLF